MDGTAKAIRVFRGFTGFSNREFGKKGHVKPEYLSTILSGKRPCTADTAGSIAKGFGLSPKIFLEIGSKIQQDGDQNFEKFLRESVLSAVAEYAKGK